MTKKKKDKPELKMDDWRQSKRIKDRINNGLARDLMNKGWVLFRPETIRALGIVNESQGEMEMYNQMRVKRICEEMGKVNIPCDTVGNMLYSEDPKKKKAQEARRKNLNKAIE